MVDDRSAKTRQQGLQQVASMIFALAAIVPLLIFAWTLHTLGVIGRTQAQVSLGLALAVALLGFWMFRSLLGRMAHVVQALTGAVEQASRIHQALAPASDEAPAPTSAEALAARVPGLLVTAGVASVAPDPLPGVAGIGMIRELSEVVRTMDALWYREATGHLNQRVQISVANSRQPLVGTLVEVTADGLILEQSDRTVPISYGRVTSIDRLA
jgi:hypothetical protein